MLTIMMNKYEFSYKFLAEFFKYEVIYYIFSVIV
jgi:hypothetical protein